MEPSADALLGCFSFRSRLTGKALVADFGSLAVHIFGHVSRFIAVRTKWPVSVACDLRELRGDVRQVPRLSALQRAQLRLSCGEAQIQDGQRRMANRLCLQIGFRVREQGDEEACGGSYQVSKEFDDLMELLKGVRMTFDRGRNITHHCTFCDAEPNPAHELATIGNYITGAELTRPVCVACMPLVRAMMKAAAAKATTPCPPIGSG